MPISIFFLMENRHKKNQLRLEFENFFLKILLDLDKGF